MAAGDDAAADGAAARYGRPRPPTCTVAQCGDGAAARRGHGAAGRHDERGEADGADARCVEFIGLPSSVQEPGPLADGIAFADGHPAWSPKATVSHADRA